MTDLAEVQGTVSNIETSNGMLLHLTYTSSNWIVTYCRNYETCSLHEENYTISKSTDETSNTPINSSGSGISKVPELENTVDYFYIADDEDYKVTTLGDLATYNLGLYGTTITEGSVFYWQCDYYYTRGNQYLTNSSNKAAYINNYGMKIDFSGFITPDPSTQPGDLKLVNGRVYIFFPNTRYSNDYLDNNYWFEVDIE